VVQLGHPSLSANAFADGEIKLFEMSGLAEVGDDHDAVGLEVLGAVERGGEIGEA